MLEEVPAFGSNPAHQHVDLIYLAHPIGGVENHNIREAENMCWFTLEEVQSMIPDGEIFAETQQVIQKVLSDSLLLCK
jgi:hypothetical protein